ncbi:DUF1963 domain-containing protein [Christensenellaceae bacterium OttesenSCG-928-L17]|nr:DUF1963 domain-containing protein [Christensenellaceae bacterium OttesenSCG-928-L17]
MSAGLQAFIVTTLTAIIVGVIMESAKRKDRTDGPEVFVVRQSAGTKVVGIICMLLFAAFLLASVYALNVQDSFSPEELPLIFGVSGFFFLLGAYVTLHASRWEIRVDNGRIEYTPVIGRTQIIQTKGIAYVVQTATKLKAYDGWHRKIFLVDGPAKNKGALEAWLRRYNVSFGRDDFAAERARGAGSRREKIYMPKGTRQKAKQMRKDNEARRRHYMTAPPTLPENLAELLKPFEKTSIRLLPGNPETPCAKGRSKFGGQPDLPPGFRWDYFEGEAPVFDEKANYKMVTKSRPLAFLLQVNCQEVFALWPESPLPKRGLLSFFYELDTMLWGPECLDGIEYVKVHYFEDIDSLVSTPLPEDLKEEYRIPAHPIVLGKEVSLPSFDVFDREQQYESTLSNHKLYDQTRISLGMPSTRHGEPGIGTRMLGWAESIQNDIFDDFTEVWLKGRVDPELELERMGGMPEAGWELLLQLDSDVFEDMGIGSIMFGDCGSVYFGIRSDDLRAKRFDKTWFTLQCY